MIEGLKALKWFVQFELHHEAKVGDGHQVVIFVEEQSALFRRLHHPEKVHDPQFPQQAEPYANVRAFFRQVRNQPPQLRNRDECFAEGYIHGLGVGGRNTGEGGKKIIPIDGFSFFSAILRSLGSGIDCSHN